MERAAMSSARFPDASGGNWQAPRYIATDQLVRGLLVGQPLSPLGPAPADERLQRKARAVVDRARRSPPPSLISATAIHGVIGFDGKRLRAGDPLTIGPAMPAARGP
jgi:hypothetical protein